MLPEIKLFNTLTLKKESFEPLDKNQVRLYTCGPTVYDYAHIGNLRTYVFEDLFKRFLIERGYQVYHVMNLTDVDDKTIKGAIKKGLSLNEYTSNYTQAFFEDLKQLSVVPANCYPKATDHIPEMIEMIEKLIDQGFAYVGSDQSVYFSINRFSHYGALSHLKLDHLQKGASNRVEHDEYDKENITDFVLWKSYLKERDGTIFWESPFGRGRPGWHIECSAMAIKYLGHTLDIHMGGVDNIFPHHENEIAQSECFSCKKFCKLWMHVEHLIVDGKKMSKSLGNFFTLRDLLSKGYKGQEIRYLLLQTHYKTQLNFTFDGLVGARHALERIQYFIARLQSISAMGEIYSPYAVLLAQTHQKFHTAFADDLNISNALAAIFDLIREANVWMDQKLIPKQQAISTLELLKSFDRILAVFNFNEQPDEISDELKNALKEREAARISKNWKEADRLRDYLLSQGYLIEDTPQGPSLKKKN